MITTYKRLKSITKIRGFSLIGKKKMLTSARIDNFQEFFFDKLDGNNLLYKCAKFQVNRICGWILARGRGEGGVNLPPSHALTLPQNPHAQ